MLYLLNNLDKKINNFNVNLKIKFDRFSLLLIALN